MKVFNDRIAMTFNSEERLQTERSRHDRGAVSALVATMLVLALLVTASVALRTQGVIGSWVSTRLADMAVEREVVVYVHALGPAGWTGLRFHGVRFEGVVRGKRVHLEADAVDVYPSLPTLGRGQGKLNEIALRGAFVRIESLATQSEGEEKTAGQRSSSARALSKAVTVRCEDCRVEVDDVLIPAGVPEGLTSLEISRAMMRMERSEQGWTLAALDARLGTSADDLWRLALEEVGRGGAQDNTTKQRLRLEGKGLDTHHLGIALPAKSAVGVGYVEFDWERWTQTGHLAVALGEVELSAGGSAGLRARMAEVAISTDDEALRLEIPRGTLWAGDGRRAVGAVDTVHLTIDRDGESARLEAIIQDRRAGRVDLAMDWASPQQRVSFQSWFADFDAGPLIRALPVKSPVKALRMGGAVKGEVGLADGLAYLTSGLDLRELRLDLPFLATEDLIFETMGLAGTTLIDLPSKSVSVTSGKVRFGQARPFEFDAVVVDAAPGWVFSGQVKGKEILANHLLDSLPPAMTGALREAHLQGSFDFSLKTSGHTAFPDSLVLDVTFGGDVEVTREGHYVDVRALGSGALPAFDSESHRARRLDATRWVRYETLPDHIPAALLSAEDASFFQHSGLDWVGLRMAMVHNLRAGQFERGGSTISQQLAKNLFLTPNRTLSRKLQEAFLTWRIEAELDKERILELYLNVVEWGADVHGIHRAAYHYFGIHPRELEAVEMVLLASILPNPIRFGDAVKQGYLPSSRRGKMERVLVNMRFLDQLSWSEYFKAQRSLEAGRVGNITLKPCGDDETAPDGAPSCAEVVVVDGETMNFEVWEVRDIPVESGWLPITHDFQP